MLVTAKINDNSLVKVDESFEVRTFKELGINEAMLEEFIRNNIGDILEDETLLIVGQQIRNSANGRNDLVAVDGDGNLVLIEIKRDLQDISRRTEPLEFQSIRYASSCATIHSPEELVTVMYEQFYRNNNPSNNDSTSSYDMAFKQLMIFLERNQAIKNFNKKQRIMLFASEYDPQALSAFAWLIDSGVDISIYAISPCKQNNNADIVIEINKILPLGNSEDFYVNLVPSKIKTNTDTSIQRTKLPNMTQLMQWGILKEGDELSIKGQSDSSAKVVNDKEVLYKEQKMKYNKWGQKVMGWSTINIYEWALLEKDGKLQTLADLRKQYMNKANN